MRFPKIRENEKNNLYDARIIETNVVIGIAICVLAGILNIKKEAFMIYSLVYSMHLTINSFVRLKYYFNLKEIDCLVFAFLKGLGFVFLPSLIIQKIIFNSIPNILAIIMMVGFLFISSYMIMIEKRNVKKEEITIKNGYMHTQIVFLLTAVVELLYNLIK